MNSKPLFTSVLLIRIPVLLALAAGGVLAPHARAQTSLTWSGTTDGNWGTAANWGNVTPSFGVTTDLTFNSNTNASLASPSFLGGSAHRTIRSLNFGANATSDIYINLSTTVNATSQFLIFGNTTSNLITVDPNSNANIFIGNNTGGVSMSGNLSVNHHGSGNLTFAREIRGSFGITKNGTGTLILSAINIYTGGTTINAGTLRIATITNGGVASGLGNSTNAAGNLVLGGGTLEYTGSGNSTDRNFTLTAGSNSTISVTNAAATLTISGTAASTNGSLTKSGAGTLTLSGNNTYTGGTTINAGTLSLGHDAALGTGTLTIAGGTLNVTAARTITNNNAQNWNGDFTFVGSNTLNLGTGAVAMSASRQVTVNASTLTVGGVISGTGFGLTKAGAGTLILSGSNTYTGATTINAGTLQIGAGGTTGSLSTSSSIINNGTLAFNRTNTVAQGTDFASVIFGTGNLTQAGSGNLTLSGNNTYTGVTTVTSGTLEITSTGRLGGGSYAGNITNNGSFIYSGTNNQTLSGVISGTGALTQNGTGALTLSGANIFTGGVTLNNGTLNINNATALGNATVGTFVINGGTIDNTSAGLVTVGAKPLTINADFAYTGGSQSLSLGTGATTLGTAAGTSRTITVNANTLTIGGAIANGATANSIIKAGAGTLTLNGTNTYTGATTINAGTLQFARKASLYNGTTASWTAANIKVGSGATLMLSVNGTGQFGTSDVTTLLTNLGGANGGSAGGFAAGSIIGFDTSSSSFTISDNIANTTGSGGGSLGLTKLGTNTLTLSGNNTYTGGTTINAGTLEIASTGRLGGGSYAGNMVNNATFLYNGTNSQTLSGVISGSGALTKNNASSTLTLSGNNTYSGLTTVTTGTLTLSGNNTGAGGVTLTAGQLNINHANALGATAGTLAINGGTIDNTSSGGAITNAGNNAISIGGSFAFGGTNDLNLGTGAVSGDITRTITLNGTGKTLTLGGTWTNTANNTTRTLTVNGIGNTLSLGGIAISANTTAATTLTIAGTANVNVTGAITDGSGPAGSGLTITNNGTVTLSGANTYTGNTTLASGVTLIANSLGSGSGSVLATVSSGNTATLGLRSDGNAVFAKNILGSSAQAIAGILNLNVDRATAGGASNGTITLGTGGTLSFNSDSGGLLFTGSNGYGLTLNQSLTYATANNQGNKPNITNNSTGLVTILGNITTGNVNNGRFEMTGTGDTRVNGTMGGGSAPWYLNKTGSGTLTLANAVTPGAASRPYVVQAGTLQFAVRSALSNATTGNWTAAKIVVASGATLAFNVGGANEFTTSDITTLLTNLAASTATTVSATTGNGMNAGSILGFDTTNASGGNFTITDTIANTTGASGGSRGLTKLGTGTLLLSGNNTYTGTNTLSAGTLQVGHANALGTSGNITFSGGTMQFASGGSGADYGSRIKNSASTMVLDTNGQSVTFSGAIDSSNTAGLTKTGTGTLTLSAANSYTGGTAINAGTLQVGDANALGTSGNITFSGGTMSFSSSGAGADYGSRIKNSASAMVFDTNGQSVTFGAIDNSNANGLTKNGSGTLTLSGANTYTGATTVNAGTLTLSGGLSNSSVTVNGGFLNQTSTGSIAGTGTTFTLTTGNATLAGTNTYTGATTVNGGTLSVLGSVASSATTVNNGATLTGNGTTGAITIASGASINPGVGVGTINTGGVTLNGGGIYNWQLWNAGGSAGSGWDLISSTGALTIGAGSNFTINISTVQNQAGTAGTASGFVNSQNYSWRLAEFGSAISGFDPNFFILNSTGFQNSLAGSFSLNATGNFLNLLYTTNLADVTYTAGTGNWSTATNWNSNPNLPTSANALTINGTGGTSTNDLLDTVQSLAIASSAGSYTIAGSGNGSTVTLNGGITNSSSNNQTISMDMNLGADQSIQSDAGNLLLSGALGTSNRTLTITGAGNVVITNTISGNGAIEKTGAGTLTLNGTNTYTGTTTVTGGTLALNGGLNNSSVTVNGGLLNQASTGSIAGTGTSFTLTTGNATLAGTNTYTGATTINGGTLTLSGGLNNSSVTVNGGLLNQTSTGSIAGTGTTFTLTTGNATLSGNNTYTGATAVNGGTLEIASTGRLGGGSYGGNISNNGTFIYSGTNNQTLSGIISGTGALTQNNSVSTLTLAGNNAYTGATTINAGTLQIGAGSTTGSLSTSSAITNNGTLAFNRTNTITQGTDFASVISGTGNLIQAGSGNLVLSGNNTYTGTTTISAGTLEIASSGRLGGGSYAQNITNNGVFLYSGTNNQTLSGIISGTGALTHNTAGGNTTTLTLAGNNTYSGNTTVSAGILNIQHANALGGSANGTTVASGAVLQLQGGINIASEALTLNGSGVSNGGALVNSSGNNEWAGNITIGSATTLIHANTGTTLTISGNITNNAGAALHFQGSGGNITVSGIISGNGSLVTSASGPPSLTLSGANTYTSTTTISGGTVSINSIKDVGAGASSLGAAITTTNGTIAIGLQSANATLRYTGSGDSSNRTINLAGQTGGATIDQSGTGTLRFTSNFTAGGAGSKTLILQGSTAGIGEIAGAVVNNNSTNTTSLTKNGTGTWILSGANTYTGATTINAGTLQIGNGSSTGSLSASSAITNNGTLVFNRSGTVTQGTNFANSISGSGNLTQAGSGTLALGGTNTYTGLTTISAGNLSISSASALGSTSGINLANATALIYTGGVGDLTRNISVTGGTGSTGTIRNDGGALTLSGALTKNGTTLALQGGSGGITVSGSIGGSNANSDLIIDGGSVTLYAANTYNGPTSIINGGTLNANFANALPTANGRTAISIDATGSGNSTLALGVSQSIASLTGNTTSTVTLGSNTLTIGTASGNTTYAGRITGGSTSALVKDGASTQVLTGDNTGFTGTTTINGTGTLQAAAAGALGGTTNIDVNGGSLLVAVANAVNSNANINLGGGTLAVSGNFNQNVGALTLSADSVIDLEGFSGILRFSGLSWASGASNAKLAIWNWSGTPQHGPPVNDYTNPSHVVFANNANLTAENLAKISFYSGGNNSGFIGNAFAQSFSDPSFSGTEIIAVPEPETYLTVVILLLGGIIYLRRQAKHREGHRPAWPKFLLGSRETTPAHHPAPQAPDPHPAHKGARSSRA